MNDGSSRTQSVADLLQDALERAEPGSFTFADLVEAGGGRAFVLLLILMNLPNMVLAPPVIAGAVAVPTLVFGVQLTFGRSKPSLPAWLLRQPVAVKALRRVMDLAGKWLRRIEGLGRARMSGVGRLAPRLLGLFSVSGGLIALVPIPGTNILPALSIVVLGIAALRRDGLMALIGTGIGLAGIAVTVAAAGLIVELVRWGLAAL